MYFHMQGHNCLDSFQKSIRKKAECEDTEANLWRDTWDSAELSSACFAFLREERVKSWAESEDGEVDVKVLTRQEKA